MPRKCRIRCSCERGVAWADRQVARIALSFAVSVGLTCECEDLAYRLHESNFFPRLLAWTLFMTFFMDIDILNKSHIHRLTKRQTSWAGHKTTSSRHTE